MSRMVTPYAQTARRGNARHRLYHAGYERHRKFEHAVAQDHQDARSLPERRGGHQAALAGATQRTGQDRTVRVRLEISNEPVCYPVRRAIYAGTWITRCSIASPTKMRTGSAAQQTDQESQNTDQDIDEGHVVFRSSTTCLCCCRSLSHRAT